MATRISGLVWLVALASLVAGVVALVGARDAGTSTPAQQPLDDNEVGRLFDGPLPGVSERTSTPVATGNSAADERIRQVALGRGYLLRGEPLDPLGTYQGRGLQQRAIDDLVDLQAALAEDEGVTLTLTSAHRSATRQRQLFLEQLAASGFAVRGRVVTNAEIASGLADDVVNHAMRIAAPPGFSRHHTGLTIDVSSGGVGGFAFEQTAAYRWLTEDRYSNAFAYGWAPSYPPGASGQGPNPEPWEWVWIGRQSAACAVDRSCALGDLEFVSRGVTAGWAQTPDGLPVDALRLRTATGTQRLSTNSATRFDLIAATGSDAADTGFRASEGAPAEARWACVEARAEADGNWSRIGCRELG